MSNFAIRSHQNALANSQLLQKFENLPKAKVHTFGVRSGRFVLVEKPVSCMRRVWLAVAHFFLKCFGALKTDNRSIETLKKLTHAHVHQAEYKAWIEAKSKAEQLGKEQLKPEEEQKKPLTDHSEEIQRLQQEIADIQEQIETSPAEDQTTDELEAAKKALEEAQQQLKALEEAQEQLKAREQEAESQLKAAQGQARANQLLAAKLKEEQQKLSQSQKTQQSVQALESENAQLKARIEALQQSIQTSKALLENPGTPETQKTKARRGILMDSAHKVRAEVSLAENKSQLQQSHQTARSLDFSSSATASTPPRLRTTSFSAEAPPSKSSLFSDDFMTSGRSSRVEMAQTPEPKAFPTKRTNATLLPSLLCLPTTESSMPSRLQTNDTPIKPPVALSLVGQESQTEEETGSSDDSVDSSSIVTVEPSPQVTRNRAASFGGSLRPFSLPTDSGPSSRVQSGTPVKSLPPPHEREELRDQTSPPLRPVLSDDEEYLVPTHHDVQQPPLTLTTVNAALPFDRENDSSEVNSSDSETPQTPAKPIQIYGMRDLRDSSSSRLMGSPVSRN